MDFSSFSFAGPSRRSRSSSSEDEEVADDAQQLSKRPPQATDNSIFRPARNIDAVEVESDSEESVELNGRARVRLGLKMKKLDLILNGDSQSIRAGFGLCISPIRYWFNVSASKEIRRSAGSHESGKSHGCCRRESRAIRSSALWSRSKGEDAMHVHMLNFASS